MRKSLVILCIIVSALFLSAFFAGCGSSGSQPTLYLISAGTPSIGTLNFGSSSGVLALNTASSSRVSTGSDPQGIVIDSQRRYCYVVNNAGPGVAGGVFQYSINRSKATLSVVEAPNASSNLTGPVSPAVTGVQPTAIAIDPGAKFVFVANYGSNSISVFSIGQTDGALSEVSGSPFAAGTKPVSLVARGTSLYVANQGDGTISIFTFDSTGTLTLAGTTAVGANTTAITSDPNGKYLFVADGTANTVTAFSASGTSLSGPTSVTVGTAPSSLYVGPKGTYLYVANSGSDDVSVFTIGSGSLSPVSGSPFSAGSAPSYVTSNLNGTLLFVANRGSGSVSSFQISAGSLSAASGSPYAVTGYNHPDGLVSLN